MNACFPLRVLLALLFLVTPAISYSQGLVLKMKDGTIKFIHQDELEEFTYSRSDDETPEEALARARTDRHRSILGDDSIQMRRALTKFLDVNDYILPQRLGEIVNFEGAEYPLSLRYFKPPQTLDRKKGDEENKKLIEERFILLTPGEPAPWKSFRLDLGNEDHEKAKEIYFLITNPDFVDGQFVKALNGVGQILPFEDFMDIPGIDKYLDVIDEARKRAQQDDDAN